MRVRCSFTSGAFKFNCRALSGAKCQRICDLQIIVHYLLHPGVVVWCAVVFPAVIYTVMSKRFMKLLVALVLTLMFTVSLLKLVLLLWSTYPAWLYADIASPNDPTTVDEWLEQQQLSQYKQLFRDKGKLLVVCVVGRECVWETELYIVLFIVRLVPRFSPHLIFGSILLCKFLFIYFRQFSRLLYFLYAIAIERWATNSDTLSVKLIWRCCHIIKINESLI